MKKTTENSIAKTFRFRIFPGKAWMTKLETTLDSWRDLFNASLQERSDACKLKRISLNRYDRASQLKEIKESNPELQRRSFSSISRCSQTSR